MKKILSIFLLLPLLLTVSCANKTSVRHRNDYAKTLKQSRGIIVLPVKAEVNMVGVGSHKERMYDYEYAIEEAVFKEAKPMLKKKGYKVSRLSRKELKDKNLFSNYEMLYEDLDKETAELYKEPLMEVEKAHNIENKVGRHAFVISKDSKGDVLFLVNYLNNVQTNAARAVGFMMDMIVRTGNSHDVDRATVLLSMVDAKTGNILWCNYFAVSSSLFGDMFKGNEKEIDSKRIDQLLSGALKTLPNRNELLDKASDAA